VSVDLEKKYKNMNLKLKKNQNKTKLRETLIQLQVKAPACFKCYLHRALWYSYTTQTREMYNFIN